MNTPHRIKRPANNRLGGKLIQTAFNLHDCDYLNSASILAVDERVQIVIDAYESSKDQLYDTCEYVI